MSDPNIEAPREGVAAPAQKTTKDKGPPPHFGAARAWWNDLTDEREGDRGALARLRRCAFPAEAWGEAATMSLYLRLGFKPEDRERRVEAVAILAIVLAGVREDPGGRLGKALALAKDDRPPPMSGLRLRRLTAARDGAEVLRGFREAVALLNGKAQVEDLARYVLGWLDPAARDRTRTRFLFEFHGAGLSAPFSSDDDNDAPEAQQTEPTR